MPDKLQNIYPGCSSEQVYNDKSKPDQKRIVFAIALYGFIFSFLILNIHNLFSDNLEFLQPKNCESLNTPDDDFAPSWNNYLKLLYFNSTRDGYSKFYTSRRSDSTDFDIPKILISEINQSRNNQSYITFVSRDEALFTTFRKSSTQSFLNIFKSVFIRQGWSEAINDDSLGGDSFIAQPTVSPDGSVLVYSSDRQAPFKDTDLWISYRQSDGSWGTAVPIEELNSRGNEITPFLESADSLFFATNGQEGPGGYDVFFSVKIKGFWSPPRPLQSINTPFDESDFVLLPDGDALFASNMPGGKGKLDLYIAEPQKKSNINSSENQVELSLQTQAFSIEIQRNSRYLDMPMAVNLPLGYLDRYKNEVIVPGITLGDYIAASFDTLKARLAVSPNKHVTIELGDSTMLGLLKLIGFSSQAVSYRFGNVDGISIKSSDPELLAPVRFMSDSFSLQPPILEIQFDARPREMAANWDASIIAGRDTFSLETESKQLPQTLFYNLKQIGNKLDKSDSVKIEFNLKGNNEKNNYAVKTMSIYRSSSESRFQQKVGSESADLFLFSSNEIENNENYSAKIRDFLDDAAYSRFTELVCYSDKSKDNAERLKSIMMKYSRGMSVRIIVESPPVSLQDWFEKNFILARCRK